ncbi:hypothetical protein LWP59_23320 [Amycolatopsis acidiphila]|uniref:3-methyl-2-oxobutanoate hydroxymethyltransferase n=1 Tax=Amycolatopsis acidiphila TaxID=715473 RepID=A0A558AF83_9PSEU|nr:3-methyl-2-oxobutanoate hydroxymethyltransferase [Amycolatopsis acidiphila]TVT22928.1 3-methyl-2-oxobutanoate hydroxymethyltransferase [Amycolatopsis acidiphila]UIJ57087.1 hypothetical protein LWP59_23320 [Amycolatopsis acidiphila]GHG53432.1 hypothetical protein GCM10017788_02170 [Amycolatopsis acidiphila]
MTAFMRPVLLNSCAMAATEEEARYRIDVPIKGRQGARVVALDEVANGILRRVARQGWNAARFLELASRGAAAVVLRDLDGVLSSLGEQLETADVVVMIATADGDEHAASAIGAACTARGIMTAGLILDAGGGVGGAGTALRPHARVLMVTSDENDVSEVLLALRA